MIQLSPLALLAFGELLFISIVISLGFFVAGINRKRNERKSVARLIGRINQDKERRRAETHSLMQENFGFKGEELESIVNRISREEIRLYQGLINLFCKRDLHMLEVLHVECEGVTEPYRTLELPKPDSGPNDVESDLAAEVEMLKEENERLSTELGVTMDTMGKMLTEYASMYAGGSGENLDKKKLMSSLLASDADGHHQEAASAEAVEPAGPASTGAQTVAPDDMIIEKEEVAENSLDDIDPGLFDDIAAIDIDSGENPGDETLIIGGMEESSVMNDETLVVGVSDDELVELDDGDLSLEKTVVDNNGVLDDREKQQKSAG
ncbi:MAG: hypothetical protein KDI74_13535 [Gammaproteobacteria bacterium]|nr:hypothetical protein [Gammaproteobacteria bacterium]